MNVAVLHGSKKESRLKAADADIYVINPEGIPWLCAKYLGRPLPFDVLVIDELTRFKNYSSGRSKTLRAHLRGGPRWRWGLTGSLAGDGNYLDVFGQQLMLDDGAALGRYITHYRDEYFTVSYDGFSYNLNRGAEERITARLAPYWFYMRPEDYATLPPLVDNIIEIEFTPQQKSLYARMAKEYVASLPDKLITAVNAGGAYSKLAQMANGAVYDEKRGVHFLHDGKIQALDSLVEELNGVPVLVSYEFNHDLSRIQDWYRSRFGAELPYLGKGTTSAQENAWVSAWNKGKLPVLAGHPASMGHGLNLQESNACHICHFSLPWSWELCDQLIGRILRSGNAASHVFNHILITKGTVDEDKLAGLRNKSFTSSGLIAALNRQILLETSETGTQAPGEAPALEHTDMVARLSRPTEAPANAAPAAVQHQAPQQDAPGVWGAPPAQAANGGWGAPPAQQPPAQAANGGWGAPDGDPAAQVDAQRVRIQQQIAPNPQEQVGAAFGAGAQAQAASIQGTAYGATAAPAAVPQGWGGTPPPATAAPSRRRRTKAEIAADEAAKAAHPGVAPNPDSPAAHAPEAEEEKFRLVETEEEIRARIIAARVELLKIAFADPTMSLEDGLEVADELWKWAIAID
jgi:hypothetical protein